MTYITKEYDFHDAIAKRHGPVIIEKVEHLTDNQSIVYTDKGKFICEGFESKFDIYMKVYEFVD